MRSSALAALLASTLALCSACAFMGAAFSMRQTKVISSDGNYDKLVAAASALGWKAQKRVGEWKTTEDWNLLVFPAEGEKIIFTLNNFSKCIDFTCKGGSLDSSDSCVAQANKLLGPAFNGVY